MQCKCNVNVKVTVNVTVNVMLITVFGEYKYATSGHPDPPSLPHRTSADTGRGRGTKVELTG